MSEDQAEPVVPMDIEVDAERLLAELNKESPGDAPHADSITEPDSEPSEPTLDDSPPLPKPDAKPAEGKPGNEPEDDLADLAQLYGVEPTVLKQFSSRSDAEAALRMFDQQLADSGKDAWKQASNHGAPLTNGQYVPPQEKPEPVKAPAPKGKLDLEEYDEDNPTRKNLEALQQQVEVLQYALYNVHQAEQEREQENVVWSINENLDAMKSDLFGSGEKLTPEQQKARNGVVQQVSALSWGMFQQGMPQYADYQALTQRAAWGLHADEINKERLRSTRDVSDKRARGKLGAPGRGAYAPMTIRDDWKGPIEEHPDLLAELQRAIGG